MEAWQVNLLIGVAVGASFSFGWLASALNDLARAHSRNADAIAKLADAMAKRDH